MGSLPADLTCPQCATAIADDSVVLLREGELFHLQCRGQTLSLEAMDAVLRVRRAWSYSAKRTARAMGRRLERSGTVRTGRCPLCEAAATLGDAGGEWTAVKGCPCDGFFIWNPLVLHLSRLLESRRATVTEAVRDLRR